MLTDFNTNGKHMIASLLGNGSVVVICSIIGVAVIAAVVIYMRKKKKDDKGDKGDE